MTAEELLGIADQLFPTGSEGRSLRLFGGLACWRHCPKTRNLFNYRPKDIDVFAPHVDMLPLTGRLKKLGFGFRMRETYKGGVAHRFEETTGSEVDVWVGSLKFNHRIPADSRLKFDWPTLPLAELLATKLQIHKAEGKDLTDAVMLVAEHEVGEGDHETINLEPLARMCRGDWGLWRNVRDNIDRATRLCAQASTSLSDEIAGNVNQRLDMIRRAIDASPKALRWHIGALCGRRGCRYWYDVEEFRK